MGKGLSLTSSPGNLDRPSAPGRCMSTSGSPPWATDCWDRLVVKGPDNSSWQRLQAPTSAVRIAAYIPMPSRSPHPHCYATQCGVGIEGCVWEVNLWLRFPRDVWAMSGHASPPPCCSRKAALWTLVLENGDVVWTKYKNYSRECCRMRKKQRRSRKERKRRHHVRGGSDRSLASASVS